MKKLFQQPRQFKVTDNHLAWMRGIAKERIYPYKPPEWAEKLKGMPSSKIEICQKHTPIQRWCLLDIPEDFEIYIKRDDLTGSTFSGHKIRKLEFHLADALEKNYKSLIGVGSAGSNYCRSIAVAGRELGFHVHLLQYTEKEKFPCNCNVFLSQMAGAHIHLVQVDDITDTMKDELKLPDDLKLIEQSAYILPINPGSDGDTGIYAFIDTFQELVTQGATENFTDLVLTCGSTTSTVAFIIGNYMTGGKLRLHGLSARYSKEQNKVIIMNLLKKYGFLQIIDSQVEFEDLISIVEESREPKYGKLSAEHVDFVRLTAASTGIFLDPVYTGKTAHYMVKMIRKSPNSFKGKKILYYNTGSAFGTLNEDLLHNLKNENGLNTVSHTSQKHLQDVI